MYKRDLLSAEIEKLAQVLARIMGLKLEGKLAAASLIFEEAMLNSFNLDPKIIADQSNDMFEKWLNDSEIPSEKLDSLSEFLYYELGFSADRNTTIAPKLNLIYNILADKHKIVHLTNLHRQKNIQQYL